MISGRVVSGISDAVGEFSAWRRSLRAMRPPVRATGLFLDQMQPENICTM
jgi:hypothetical protein